MSWKQNTAIVATVVALGLGAAAALDPPRTAEDLKQQQQQQQQQLQDLSDSNDNNNKRIEDESEDQRRAEDERKLIPGEHRPHLPFPFRW